MGRGPPPIPYAVLVNVFFVRQYLNSCCCIPTTLVSTTVNLTKKQYDVISSIADKKYNGNFSKAIRNELGFEEKPRFVLEGLGNVKL